MPQPLPITPAQRVNSPGFPASKAPAADGVRAHQPAPAPAAKPSTEKRKCRIRLGRALIDNPHDPHRQLRAEEPASQVAIRGGLRVWLVTRYNEARALLSDPRLGKDHATMLQQGPGVVQRMRPGIERITGQLLDAVGSAAADDPVGLVECFAIPLPLSVIGDLTGAPARLRDSFRTAVEPPLSTTRPREVAKHLAFGHGIHYCVGAPLARLEAQIVVGRLLARFGRITLDETATVQCRSSTLTRALKSLPARLAPT